MREDKSNVAFGVIVVDNNMTGVLFGCSLGGVEDEFSDDVGF